MQAIDHKGKMLASATLLAGCSLHEKRKTNPKKEKFRIWVLSVNYCMSERFFLYISDFNVTKSYFPLLVFNLEWT